VRRQALVLVCCALALMSVAGASSADEIDWKTLPNFNYVSQRLHVSTDASWQGAKAVDAGPQLNLQTNSEFPKLKWQWIWAPACGQAAQRAVFSKTFMSPGVPYDGTFNLLYGPGNQLLGNRPYSSASLQINGVELGRLGDIARFPRKFGSAIPNQALSARALKAVRYGLNTMTIRVDRAALKPGEPCTRPWATSGANVRYVAVAADLTLGYASDLRAIGSDQPRQVARVVNGKSVTIRGTSRFSNDGPSSSLGGTFTVSITGDGQSALAIAQPQSPLEQQSCKLEGRARMTCTYDEVRSGMKAGILVVAGTNVNTAYFKNGAGLMTLLWSVDGRNRDPNGSNNAAKVEIVLCAAGATDPACS
jgi:hypothetical protein